MSKGTVMALAGIRKSFPSGETRLEVLRGVDLQVGAGESVSVQGESGSGKTTLVHLAAGLDAPDEGRIYWEETNLQAIRPKDQPRRRAAFLGMVFQSFYLVPELTARENVLLGARLAGRSAREAAGRADYLLGKVGLGERGHHIPAHLSGGEQQRVALARALINRPRMVLADEPTGNLDERTGDRILSLLLENCAAEGTALLLVTHNKAHAAQTDRQLYLHLGEMEDRSGGGLK